MALRSTLRAHRAPHGARHAAPHSSTEARVEKSALAGAALLAVGLTYGAVRLCLTFLN